MSSEGEGAERAAPRAPGGVSACACSGGWGGWQQAVGRR